MLEKYRRALIILLIGLFFVSILDWWVNNIVHHYQTDQQSKYNNGSLFGGAVFLGLRDNLYYFWCWISKNSDAIIAIFTIVIGIFTSLLFIDSREKGRKELRAYIAVVTGSATYQESGKGTVFAGIPRIVNTGKTPAHNVRHKTKAAILPIQIQDNFSFNIIGKNMGGSIIGPNHFNDLQILVDDFVLDSEVNDIKIGKSKALYVWGIVNYDDIFGDSWETEFCQALTWIGEGKNETVYGYYNARHNKAT